LSSGAGVAPEQIPGKVERLLDGAPLRALADEPPLKVVDESECAVVVIRERPLTHDRGEVRVHVPGVASPAGNLFARGGSLAQGHSPSRAGAVSGTCRIRRLEHSIPVVVVTVCSS
jgi:hypothetical protein